MRIAIIRPFPTVISDANYNVQEFGLGRALANEGISVDIYCAGNVDNPDVDILWHDNGCEAKVIRLPYINIWPNNGLFKGLRSALKSSSYDLLQTQGYEQITSFLVTLYGKRSKVPVIIHEGIYDDSNYGFRIAYWMRLFRTTLGRYIRKNVIGCLAKTEKAKEYLISKGFKNIKVLPIGLDISKFENPKDIDWRTKLNIPCGSKVLLYIGKIEKRRNPDFLILVLSKLIERGIEVFLVLVGQGPELDVCKRLAERLGVQKHIRFVDYVRQRELPSLYRTADLFLFPSSYEIVGMVLLESLFFKLPVCTTSTGGGRDIIKSEFGKIFSSLDLNEWVSFIKDYFSFPNKFGFKNKLESTPFRRSWNNIAHQYVRFYRQVVQMYKRLP